MDRKQLRAERAWYGREANGKQWKQLSAQTRNGAQQSACIRFGPKPGLQLGRLRNGRVVPVIERTGYRRKMWVEVYQEA